MRRFLPVSALLFLFQQAPAQTYFWETAVNETDNWRYVVPSSEPDTNWRKAGFNASSWQQGPGGIGFGDNDDNTVIAQSVSVYMRITFNIPDTSKISEAILNVDYDDGFVAYINNVEMARANMNGSGPPAWNDLAAGSHEAVMYGGGNPDYFSLPKSSLTNVIVPGTNVLCIQAHNVTAGSSDLSSRVWLSFGINDTTVSYFGPTPSWFIGPVSFTSSNLPIIVINTNNQAIVDDPKIMADMGIIYNGPGVRNYMTDPFNEYNGKIGIEVRGSSSQMFPKKSFGMELWNINSTAIDTPLLGMPTESDWILSANYSDKSLLNNSMAYHIFRRMGHYSPRTQHVELVIDGEYQGVYVFMEKIKRDKNRVDISKLQPLDISGDQLSGGYIIKIDKTTGSGGTGWTSSYAPLGSTGGQQIDFQYEYPSEIDIMPQQQAYIQSYVDSFETALNGPNFASLTVGYSKYIDVTSFTDYFLLNEISRNVDGYRLSTYLFKDRDSKDGKLYIGPPWDYDIAWQNANYCRGNDTTGWAYRFNYDCSGDNWQIPFWWERLLQDPVYANHLRCRWETLKTRILSKDTLLAYCDSMAAYLNEGQQRNFGQWPILGQYVWPNPSPIPSSYQGEIDELKNWITARWNWLDANMPGSLSGCDLSVHDENTDPLALSVYPNPFGDIINMSFSLDDHAGVSFSIADIAGRTVLSSQEKMNAGFCQYQLNTGTLSPGIYLLTVKSGAKQVTRKIVRR